MKITLDEISKSVKEELKEFDKFFAQTLKNEHPLLKLITNFILRRKGKRIRPLFVILSAKLNGQINEKTYVGATLIELLHSATLIHDDVVDNSERRRGFFSLKALWGNKIAVLVGDYLLSKGLLISLNNQAEDLLKIVANAVEEMAEGELMQLKKSRFFNLNEQEYFEIIKKKTATLISASTQIGAKSVNAPQQYIENMKNFGIYMGISFQLKDDLLDLQSNKTGKSFGNDIREKKVTLPLIKSLENAPKKIRKKIINQILRNDKTEKDILEIIDFINKYKGIELTQKALLEYSQKAKDTLKIYPDTEVKQALIKLVDFNINRKK